MTPDYCEVVHVDPDECQTCWGAGFETCTDPLCTEPGCKGGWHECPNCGGSGRAEDQQDRGMEGK